MDALGPALPRLSRPGGMGWLSPSRHPQLGCCYGQGDCDCDGLCVARGRRSPCPGRRPGAGHGRGARGGAAAITAQPLPPGSSSLLLVAIRSLFSPLSSGARSLPGDFMAPRFRGGDGLRAQDDPAMEKRILQTG